MRTPGSEHLLGYYPARIAAIVAGMKLATLPAIIDLMPRAPYSARSFVFLLSRYSRRESGELARIVLTERGSSGISRVELVKGNSEMVVGKLHRGSSLLLPQFFARTGAGG